MTLFASFIALMMLQPGASCAAAGRSIDQDPAGLNVRAGPSLNARILGRLYSVLDAEAVSEGSNWRYGPIFAIREVRGGWVRIVGAAAESEGTDGQVRRNYTGAGWISANMVEPTIVSTSTGDPAERGYAGPGFSSPVVDPDGHTNVEAMERSFQHPRLIACSGRWVQLDYVRSGRLNANRRWVQFPVRERRRAQAWFQSGAPGE